jgi:hypothetical protein
MKQSTTSELVNLANEMRAQQKIDYAFFKTQPNTSINPFVTLPH